MTTEQETGRGAAARRAVPKTGTRRYAAPHQSKPRPRPDTRPDTGAKRAPVGGQSAAEELRTGAESAREARASARPVPRPRPARRQRTPFVLLVVGLMSGGLVSLLLLNTMLAQDTITDATLREEIAVARRENEKLEQEYQLKTQPDAIAKLAEQQGQQPDWDNVNGWTSAGDRVGQVDTER
ncbi:hypothetical protein [Nonomuraea polychroma]|uniref:hypothetical protein n=1 Tax=Nonomuraea polychroma TaxID=46176 RepID=UPI000FDDAAC3|nr:hypothetical protein [Nonomuraea polychroma]